MITLEITPDLMNSANPMLDMNTQAEKNGTEKIVVQKSPEGKLLGWARQNQNPAYTVRFFQGKGGFSVVISGRELVYFGLPGSRIVLSDTEVELSGNRINGKPSSLIYPQTSVPVQTVTHQVMVLGAGLATRFEPISGDATGYSKPAVPLVGQDSVIALIAKLIKQHGFSTMLVNTFYKPDSLKQQLNSLSGIKTIYIDEEAPSGTAGGLVKALKQGMVDKTRPLIIIQGDAITNADLSFLMQAHVKRNAAVTIGGQIVRDEDVSKFGIIETDASGNDGQSGNITSFKEKPALQDAGKSRFANAGFYVLAPEVFDLFIEVAKTYQEKQLLYDYAQHFFPAVLKAILDKKVINCKTGYSMCFWAEAIGGYWSDMGTPAQYIEAMRDIYDEKTGIELPKNIKAYYDNDIIYWPGAKETALEENAVLEGNVIVALRTKL